MRTIQYLSPSAIDLYQKDREAYYMRYLADSRPPRDPQTIPMSIGSAFDCYVKSHIADCVWGRGVKSQYAFETMFERAVEPELRDQARVDGMVAFQLYQSCGALADLMTQLHAASDVNMEFEVQGTVLIQRPGGVVLLGKPDLSFRTSSGRLVLLDWKVNGAYSKYNTSPMKGYLKCRNSTGYGSQPHKECVIDVRDGIRYNSAVGLETLNPSWARQLSIYSWLCGGGVGDELLVAVDQIVGSLGSQRVAEHRLMVCGKWQLDMARQIDEIWEIVNSDHFFRELSLEESKGRCSLLEGQALAMYGASSDENDMWKSVSHVGYRG